MCVCVCENKIKNKKSALVQHIMLHYEGRKPMSTVIARADQLFSRIFRMNVFKPQCEYKRPAVSAGLATHFRGKNLFYRHFFTSYGDHVWIMIFT